MIKRGRKIKIDDMPRYTMIGVGCGIVALICFTILVILASVKEGGIGLLSGFIGVLALGVGIYGLCMNVKGIKENENMFFTLPLIGVTLNSAMVILFLIVYIKGLIL